ncbi:MAG: PHB depolymerase family esterase [Candidatus Neomarinimicrobiota bacterium]
MKKISVVMLILILSCSKSEVDNKSVNNKSKDYFDFTFYEGVSTNYIQHGGLSREYLLYIPSNIDNLKNLPVIFNFHGYLGQAVEFFNSTDLVEIADNNGVVLVYPQGSSLSVGASHWNAAPPSSSSKSFVNKSNTDDIGFFKELLNEINQDNMIDLNRVYVIGYSNGGMFSHFLACNTDNIIAAIGDVAGTMLNETFENCNPSSPIPILKIHGTADGVVGYNGYNEGEFKSVEEVLDFWKSHNSSNADVVQENLGSTSIYSEFFNTSVNVNFEKYTYKSDENNSEVVHYKIINGGHWWDYSSDESYKTSTLLWDFFSKHSKQ